MNSEFQLAKKIYSKDLPPMLKGDILSTLKALRAEQTFDLSNPPLLTKYADIARWKEGIKHLNAPKHFDSLFIRLLFEDETRTLMLAWATDIVPDEEHLDLKESFLILEGTCTFKTESFSKNYSVGDYVEVPDCHHSVIVTSQMPLKAVIQRLKAA